MIKPLIPFLILCSVSAFGQGPGKNICADLKELTVVDSISDQDIIGDFSIRFGNGNYGFQLNSNRKFQEIQDSYLPNSKVDKGSWSVLNCNTVVLNSKKQQFIFDLVKFDNFYFFVQPLQRQKFVENLRTAKIILKNYKSIKLDGRIISTNYLVALMLNSDYLGKAIEENAGISDPFIVSRLPGSNTPGPFKSLTSN